MSLLDSIKQRQNNLKNTVTFVTCPNGKVYRETKYSVECIGSKLGFVIDNKPDNIPAKIVEFVYLGSQDCCDQSVILKYNFKYVLSVGVEATYKHPDVIYKFIECLDLPECNLQPVLENCIPFIKLAVDKGCNILVHCNAGVSRSASVVIGYIMLYKNVNYMESYKFVKKARNCINPNAGFVKYLQNIK